MKKMLLLLSVFILGIVITGCTDKKYEDDTVNVIFYTASNQGATEIMPYIGVEPGTLIEQPEDPIRLGYSFGGWFSDISYTKEWKFDTDVVKDKSFAIYAKWEVIISSIYYTLNGGEMPNNNYPQEYRSGDRTVLPIPKRTGFKFLGWYTYEWDEENPKTRPSEALKTIPSNAIGDLSLHAHWESIVSSVVFRINFKETGKGPDPISNLNVAYGEAIDFPVFDVEDGYKFMGWNSRSDGTGTWYENGEIFTRTQRITVYGIWEKVN